MHLKRPTRSSSNAPPEARNPSFVETKPLTCVLPTRLHITHHRFPPPQPMNSRNVTPVILLVFVPACLYLTAYLRLVPMRHIVFVLITSFYALFNNTIILRTFLPAATLAPRSLAPVKRAPRLLFPFTFIFSLLVPTILLYVAGTSRVDATPTKLAYIVAPPLFLIMSQITLETIGFLFSTVFTVYIRLAVTIAFVSYRIPVMVTWYQQARDWAQSDEATLVPPYAVAMTQAGAVLNIVFWTFVLLCFLLLYCLPAIIQDPQKATSNAQTPARNTS